MKKPNFPEPIPALQTALISQFGEDTVDFAHTMNGVAGAVITALLITLSAMMLAKATKKDTH